MTAKKTNTRKQRPVLLSNWSDYNTLGIFCKKVGLIEYAENNLSCLRKDSESRRIFLIGVAEADECTFKDLAYEISEIREHNDELFDGFIAKMAGHKVCSEIKEAIKDCQDWETTKMIEGGREIEKFMVDRYNHIQEENILEEAGL